MAAGASVSTGQAGSRSLDLDLDLDLDLGTGKLSAMDSMRPLDGRDLDADSTPALLAADKREFAASQIGVSRSVATEELFDVQQQADFFMSLGEYQQAVDVLKSHLAESQEPSPLAYLDLLKIYHKLGRRDDYQRLREDFNRLFNAGAPSFEHYSDEGRGLEHYGMALSRIQALWPEPRVLDVIESSIFREENNPEAEVFDLEAYRELLLLHAIAKEVITRANAKHKGGGDFEHTAIKPLKAAGSAALAAAVAESAQAGRETQPLDEIPLPSPRLGLDVDLDELSEISAFEASLPEVVTPVEPSAKPLTPPGRVPDDDLGNLIDFEVLDFMPPEPDDKKP
jgi:tetratricopeptide (TPR) repeat protein